MLGFDINSDLIRRQRDSDDLVGIVRKAHARLWQERPALLPQLETKCFRRDAEKTKKRPQRSVADDASMLIRVIVRAIRAIRFA